MNMFRFHLKFPLVLLMLSLSLSSLQALEPLVPTQRLVTSQYKIAGDSQQDIINEAASRAVKSAVGRVYFSDYMLRAVDLLDLYLDKNASSFITRNFVSVNEIRGGRRYMELEVVVDTKKLYDDIMEKRFIYRPEVRPVFTLFLSETFNGATPPERVGRKLLLETIQSRQYRYLWQEGTEDSPQPVELPFITLQPHQDVGLSPESLANACREAQRHEVEVFVTGSVETTTVKKDKVYFDTYEFVETRCTLKLVRSDTGEVLKSVETVTSSGNVDTAMAIKESTTSAIEKLAPVLFDAFDNQWAKTIHRKATMRVLTVGIADDSLGGLKEILAGVSPDSKIFTRGRFADTAVFAIDWPGEPDELIKMLRRSPHPTFSMAQIQPNTLLIEIQKQ